MSGESAEIWDRPIGIAGGGVMGSSLAADLASRGRNVVIYETSSAARQEVLRAAKREMRSIALMRGRRVDIAAALARVDVVDEPSALAPCRLVIENVTESAEIKKDLYRQLQNVLREDALLFFNSSTYRVSDIADWFGGFERVVGVHFMNPVGLIDAVEMVTSTFTPDPTISLAVELLALMGKRALRVSDAPGYISNRVYMVTVNEAVRCLQEGVADAATIDDIFRACLGWKAGPIATADLIGLDTIKLSLESLYEAFHDEKYKPAALLAEMTNVGRLGRKSGAGFYDYD
jgi:3-hydroxybutyryl-CoA dehydrogenase